MTRWTIGTLALVAILVAGCSEEKAAEKPPRPLRTAVVAFQEIGETIEQTGEIRPRFETAMSFQTDGKLVFRVENGAKVKAGDVVARLDRRTRENGVLTAQAELATAKAERDLAGVNAERNRALFEKNITPQAQVQQTDASLAMAEAKVSAAEASLATAEETLSYTELRADRDGVISAVGSNEGQVVGAGQMVVTLISDAERDAIFDVPERLIQMNPNTPSVAVMLISEPTVTAKGRIREITPSADPATRTYRVKVGLDAEGSAMPFGAAVRGSIILSPQKLAVLPSSA